MGRLPVVRTEIEDVGRVSVIPGRSLVVGRSEGMVNSRLIRISIGVLVRICLLQL